MLPVSNPQPAHRETIYSYLSRLAAAWRTSVADLAYDIGAPFKSFLDQKPEAFDALADWAALDPQQMEEMLSWTGLRAGNVRMSFRGEMLLSRALRNPEIKGCPACLREDAAAHDGPDVAGMVMRGDWHMREANVCVRHHHPLVPLWTFKTPRDRYDFAARLREIETDILTGRLDQPASPPSAYDFWLNDRLEDGRDETWFKGQPLFAATTFCRLLGQAVLGADQSEETNVRFAPHAAGFDVARHGETAIRAALDEIATSATHQHYERNKAFGVLYTTLTRDYAVKESFAPFRRILRECILDHWPIAPGELLLGEVVTERRLHSVATAAKEIGVGAQVVEPFLIEAGAIAQRDDCTQSRRVFDAQTHAALLKEIPTLVGPAAMRKAMGATKRELLALTEEGLLVPRTRATKVKSPWRISDGTEFVTELAKMADPVAEDAVDWETLLLARNRTKISLVDLIAAIRKGQLSVGQREGIPGFHGIVVSKSEVDDLPAKYWTGESTEEMDVPGVMSAAEFARSVGLRGNGHFIALIEAGHIPVMQCTNPKTGRIQYRLSAEDISNFHRRFVTVSTLSEETGHHRNTVRNLLSRFRVSRFSPDGQDFGLIYLRSEASKALA
jgi:hypothetical protein